MAFRYFAIPMLVLCAAFFQNCNKPTVADTLFSKLDPKDTKLDFVNVNVENEQINILTYEYLYNGSGVAMGDVNNDGLVDIYLTSNNQENKLFLNKGNFVFEDISTKAGAGCKAGWKTGCSFVDINNDGWLDIYVCRSADSNPDRRRNSLLINNKDLTFTDRAKEMGLDDESYTTQTAFFDFDRDGDLDMFALNHSLIEVSKQMSNSPVSRLLRTPSLVNRLFRNDGGHFTDISVEAGILGNASNYGLGINVADINNDGWPDIYVSNDYVEKDQLYINNHDGTFSERGMEFFDHFSHFSMGLDIADINSDGLPDIFTSDMLPEDNARQKLLFGPNQYDKLQIMEQGGFGFQFMRNMLQLNNGDGTFSEIGQLAGVSNTDWTWAPLLADFDNDGYNDLFATNGYKRDFTDNDFLRYRSDTEAKSMAPGNTPKLSFVEMIKKMPQKKVPNYCFRNRGDLTFENMSEKWGFSEPVLSNGAAYADLDNDGDLDLVLNNLDDKAGVYRNNAEKFNANNHFIRIKLQGEGGNSAGLGAKVWVWTNGKTLYREQSPVRGYQSSVDPALHFGLGEATEIDSLKIQWLSGKTAVQTKLPVNQMLTLSEKDAVETPIKKVLATPSVFNASTGILDFKHVEDPFIDFNSQRLLPGFLSRQGPCMAQADLNGDGLPDVFVGGAAKQSGAVFLQIVGGKFRASSQPALEADKDAEDTDAQFFDANGDGQLDLLVASGGNCFPANSPLLRPRLYLNDGKGNFSRQQDALPSKGFDSGCVSVADFDRDGDQDIFIGSRLTPGRYPQTPPSFLFQNDGKGSFKEVTASICPLLQSAGMVSDAVWLDINGDQYPELLVCGEWMPIRVFQNEGGKSFKEISTPAGFENTSGWWNTLHLADLDGDGDLDIVAGNLGTNCQMKADPQHPASVTFKDFDGNGSIDPVWCYDIQGKSYPAFSRDEILDQLPGLRKKYGTYAAYSNATISDFFSEKDLEGSITLTGEFFETALFINNGNGTFSVKKLPVQAQFSPVYAIASADFNGDGHVDLVLAGNQSPMRVSVGRFDANHGQLYLGDGKGGFVFVSQQQSGLNVRGDVRALEVLKFGGKTELLFGVNNAGVRSAECGLRSAE